MTVIAIIYGNICKQHEENTNFLNIVLVKISVTQNVKKCIYISDRLINCKLGKVLADSYSVKISKYRKVQLELLTCGRLLKLPSLFAARFLWTFHNKLHNMKALVILSHHDHHFSHILVFMKKNNFCGSLLDLMEYFREKNFPQLTGYFMNREGSFKRKSFVGLNIWQIVGVWKYSERWQKIGFIF